MHIGKEYLRISKEKFKAIKELGDKTLQQLTDAELHWSLNEESNSISIIMTHLSGNMVSRWTNFLSSDGEKANRNRDEEFLKNKQLSKHELINIWENGWQIFFNTLHGLAEEDLLKYVSIRGEALLVIEAIERQLSHYAYHIGQIVYIGKQIKKENWSNLSIPRGKSEQYLQHILAKSAKDKSH